jgi:hypothetical protein
VSTKVEQRLRKAYKELTGKSFKPADAMDDQAKRIADLITALRPLLVAPEAATAMGMTAGQAPSAEIETAPVETEAPPVTAAEPELVSAKDATRRARAILTAANESLALHNDIIENFKDSDTGAVDLAELLKAYPPIAKTRTAQQTPAAKKSKAERTQEAKATEAAKPLNTAGVVSKGEGADSQVRIDAATRDIDPTFDTFTLGSDALNHIIQTGNPFEALVAERIKPFARNALIVAIKKGETVNDRLPVLDDPSVQEQFNNALGLHLEVTVDGKPAALVLIHASNNGRRSGANVITVLHELFHAATVQKLKIGTYVVDRQSEVTRITKELTDLMNYVKTHYDHSGKGLGIPEHAFDNVREFVAYGMTDSKLQAFMAGIQGKKTTALSRFVETIRRLWNIPASRSSALLDLITNTDALLNARLTDAEQTHTKYIAAKIVYDRTNKRAAAA